MMAGMSDYLEDALLNHVFLGTPYTAPAVIYVALFTDAPLEDGTDGVEVTGGAYTRQPVTWELAAGSDSKVQNASTVNFGDMPDATVVGAGLFDDPAAGNMLAYEDLSSSVTYAAGVAAMFETGAIAFTMD